MVEPHELYAGMVDQITEMMTHIYDDIGPGHHKKIYVDRLCLTLQCNNHVVWRQVRARDKDSARVDAVDLVVNQRVAVNIVVTSSVRKEQLRDMGMWLRGNGVLAVGLVFSTGGEILEGRCVPAEDNYDARWP